MDSVTNLPAESDALPWDRRAELGTVRAFSTSILEVIFEPGLFTRLRGEARIQDSLLFVLLSTLPFSFTLSFIQLPFSMNALTWETLGMGLVCLLGMSGVFVVMTLVGAAVDHFLLRLFGASQPYRVTLRAHALSHASWVIGWLPFFGNILALIGALVTRARAYQGLHRVSWGPAIIGALVFPLSTSCLCVGGFAALLLLGKIH